MKLSPSPPKTEALCTRVYEPSSTRFSSGPQKSVDQSLFFASAAQKLIHLLKWTFFFSPPSLSPRKSRS